MPNSEHSMGEIIFNGEFNNIEHVNFCEIINPFFYHLTKKNMSKVSPTNQAQFKNFHFGLSWYERGSGLLKTWPGQTLIQLQYGDYHHQLGLMVVQKTFMT